MKCIGCKIEVNNLTENCPICGKHLHDKDPRIRPVYMDVGERERRSVKMVKKAILFIAWVFSLVLLLINLLTYPVFLWSLIPISLVWLVWILVAQPIIKKRITPLMLVLDSLLISGLLLAADYFFTGTGWSITYAVPFILFSACVAASVIIMVNKMTRKKYYLFQMSIALLCMLPILARIFFEFILWPSLVAGMYGLVTIIALLVFGDKNLKNEARKRLHI
ncbi:MAG: DUF6320 domain-containing protein [Clostridia bacterium]